jgi:hypothetical protein
MAGDSYSFVIENFEERNVGRYSITAENQHGKATCSAEMLLESSSSSLSSDFAYSMMENSRMMGSARPMSESMYTEEIITRGSSGGDAEMNSEYKISKQQQQGGLGSSSMRSFISESRNIESSMPMMSRDHMSTTTVQQSVIPTTHIVREMSSSSSNREARETGIKVERDYRESNKGTQIEVIKKRDESSQWLTPDVGFERYTRIVNESAPFVTKEESRFSSTNADDSSVTHSYSYKEQSYGFGRGGAGAVTTGTGASDFSSTLIKDVKKQQQQMQLQRYEPIEFILDRQDNFANKSMLRGMDSFYQRSMNRFEPVNLIFERSSNYSRSGSLPPLISRMNFRSARSDFDHTDIEEESHFYADHSSFDKENYQQEQSYSSGGKMTYYKEVEKKFFKPSFKPVELVLDASYSYSSDFGKRYRDSSLPTIIRKRIRMPFRDQNYVNSSFIYDTYYTDFDSLASDFISDRQQQQQHQDKYVKYKSEYVEERESRGRQREESKFPTMKMTIDLKTPPCVQVPLKNITVTENHIAKLECVITG